MKQNLIPFFENIEIAEGSVVPVVQRIAIQREAYNCIMQTPLSLFWWPDFQLTESPCLEFSTGFKLRSQEIFVGEYEFSVWIISEGEPAQKVFSYFLDSKQSQLVNGWYSHRIDLSEFKRKSVKIGFQARAIRDIPSVVSLWWANPILDIKREESKGITKHSEPKHPHLLMLSADALRRDYVSCFGEQKAVTPAMDSLAREGLRFENIRTNSDATFASYVSFLTGRLPSETKLFSDWGDFPHDFPNLIQVLKAHGYETILISGSKHLANAEDSFTKLFDHHLSSFSGFVQNAELSVSRALRLMESLDWSTPKFIWLQFCEPGFSIFPDKSIADKKYANDPTLQSQSFHPELIKFICEQGAIADTTNFVESALQKKIFYPWVRQLEETCRSLRKNTNSESDLSRLLCGLFQDGYGKYQWDDLLEWLIEQCAHLQNHQINNEFIRFSKEFLKRIHLRESNLISWTKDIADARYPVAMYAASVESLDKELGRLFDWIKQNALWESTCVALFSTHGQCLLEEGMAFKNSGLIESVLRIPAILKPAGHSESVVVDTPVELRNFGKYILDSCKLGEGMLLYGKSVESTAPIISIGTQGTGCAVFSNPWKVVVSTISGLPWLGVSALEKGAYLFDCSRDNGEFLDNLQNNDAIIERLLPRTLVRDLENAMHTPLLQVHTNTPLTPDYSVSQEKNTFGFLKKSEQVESEYEISFLKGKTINIARLARRFLKERDYLIRLIKQLEASQNLLYGSKRWRIANALRFETPGYPESDKLFKKFNRWIKSKKINFSNSLLDTEDYQHKIIKARPAKKELQARVKDLADKLPKFFLFVPSLSTDLTEYIEQQMYPSYEVINSLEALNKVSEMEGYILYLQENDQPEPQMLAGFAQAIINNPQAPFLFADEGYILENKRLDCPFFKPDWSPELMESMDATGRAVVFSNKALATVPESYRWISEGRIYRTALAIGFESTVAPYHLKNILFHSPYREREKQRQLWAKDLQEIFTRKQEEISVEDFPTLNVVRVKRPLKAERRTTILIPTRDRLSLLKRCIDSLVKKTSYPNYEILILDNASSEPETLDYFATCGHRVMRIEGEFNYAGIHNRAVQEVTSDWMIFLNNDTEIEDADWIQTMAEYGQRSEIGAVGIRLLFPNGKIQHAGVVMGILARAAHAFAGCRPDDLRAFSQLQAVRNYSAVTAACMFTRREVFLEMGGFDEERFKIAYNDVDYCLRLWKAGYRVVSTPFSSLIHHESASRPKLEKPEEVAALQTLYLSNPEWFDPFYHPELRQDTPDFIPTNFT